MGTLWLWCSCGHHSTQTTHPNTVANQVHPMMAVSHPSRTVCPQSSGGWPGHQSAQLPIQSWHPWDIPQQKSDPCRSHLAAYRTQSICNQCTGARNVRTAPEVSALTGRSPYWASMGQTRSGASHECSIGLGSGSLEAVLTPWTLCHVPQSTFNWEHCHQGGHLVWNGVWVVGACRVASTWIPVNNISKDWSMYMCGYIQYIHTQQHSGLSWGLDVLDDVIYCRHMKR